MPNPSKQINYSITEGTAEGSPSHPDTKSSPPPTPTRLFRPTRYRSRNAFDGFPLCFVRCPSFFPFFPRTRVLRPEEIYVLYFPRFLKTRASASRSSDLSRLWSKADTPTALRKMRHVAALLRKRVILVVQDAVISLFGSDLTEDLALARLIPLHHGITLYLSLALRR